MTLNRNETDNVQAITIIALHGNGGGAFRFERVHAFIPPDVRFIAITLPGFASKPADPSLRSMEDYAAYVRKQVEHYRQPDSPIVLLGTGIGGSIILEYLQHFSDSIDAAILHAPVGTRLESRRFPLLMKPLVIRKFAQWLISSRVTRPLFKRLLFVDHTHIPPAYLDQFFDEYRQCSVFGQMFDLITADWYNGLRSIDLPSGLLWGEKERILNVEHINDYKSLLPHNLVRLVPTWDHFPMIEQPESYAAEVIRLSRQLLGEFNDR